MAKIHPTTIVIFGATGDLFRRKLAPALLDLFARDFLPKKFRLVAFSRRPWSREEFRNFMVETLKEKASRLPQDTLNRFLKSVFYMKGDFGSVESYHAVAKFLSELDRKVGVCMNKLFYLATPPSAYEGILKHISTSGLAIPCAPEKNQEKQGWTPLEVGRQGRPAAASAAPLTGWTRILIEKPFGNDLANAIALDLLLGKLFSENQIFRIDHYLAKETVQNILTFRFRHAVLESWWNKNYIERVEIRLLEKQDVGARGAFYDGLGALRDVGQNHLLELAALVAMEKPFASSAEALQKRRAEVLAKFKLWSGKGALSVRGRYDGYLKEVGVAFGSKTETYFKVKLALPTKRFKDVPFILESGKALSESRAEVSVHFKEPISSFCSADVCQIPDNVVTFRLESESRFDLESGKRSNLGFDSALGAYERVLADAILGDQTLFISTDEVFAEWKIVRDIFKSWQSSESVKYKKGAMPDIK